MTEKNSNMIIDNTNIKLPVKKNDELKILMETINKEFSGNNENDITGYFIAILNNLLSEKDISMKTEYLNVQENFNAVRLEFLAKYCKMPYLRDFIKMFEKKRVSLERKGRKELVMTLEKREEAQKEQQQKLMQQSMFGY